MNCRGFHYEIGKTVKSDDAIRCGNAGFHSCEAPFDVLKYYPKRDGNRYFMAEASGKIDRTGAEDSKLSSSELTMKAEISFKELVKAQVEFTRKKAERGTAGGDWSTLAGGNSSNISGGNSSTLAGGNRSTIAGGDRSLIVCRNAKKAKGGMHSVIVLTEWKCNDEGEYIPVCVKAEIVDGERINPDTWYTLKNGEFTEVK